MKKQTVHRMRAQKFEIKCESTEETVKWLSDVKAKRKCTVQIQQKQDVEFGKLRYGNLFLNSVLY